MKYKEIATFLSFILHRSIKRRFDTLNKTLDDDKLYDELKNYDFKPVLWEIHHNFTKNWKSERIINRLESDYAQYLLDFKIFKEYYPENLSKVLTWKYNHFEGTLKNPTFLEPNMIPTFSKDSNTKEDDLIDEPDYTNYVWFKVGLELAKGNTKNLSGSFPNRAKELGFIDKENASAAAYLRATLNDYTQTNMDKNIYRDHGKVLALYHYCEMKDIFMDEDFIKLKEGLTTQ